MTEIICAVCQSTFEAAKPRKACSKPCTNALRNRNRMATMAAHPEREAARIAKASAARKAFLADPVRSANVRRLSSERMKKRHTDPKFQAERNIRSSKALKSAWANRREHMTNLARERYAKMAEEGTGLLSDEAKANKVKANRWIMRRAARALMDDPRYHEIRSEVTKRLRGEMPYEERELYADYLSRLAIAANTDPDVRAYADTFMGKAIPEAAAEWNAKT